MSEAMTVETVIDAYWQLEGYWTKLRYAIQTENNGWTDIDVLAYNPEENELVICESKVRGKKNLILAYIPEVRNEGKMSFIDFDKNNKGYLNYLSFLENLNTGFLDKIRKDLHIPERTKITIHLVSNYYIDENILDSALEDLKKDIMKRIDSSYVVNRVIIDTTFGIFCKIIKAEKEKNQGRRYGHPVIDIAREFNRYMDPDIVRKKSKGFKKPKSDEYKEKLKGIFKKQLEDVL
jgi:hypothetical protein